jgi:hypothetical protein
VRIPLDYYRILGLPIQATADQLKQSHRDRTLQIPRREYSELAIEARRQLIDAAYSVLGDSIRRAEYDQEFLAASKSASAAEEAADAEANVPTITIEDHQLVGALLILLELGEYELVLRLGRPYLKRDLRTAEGPPLNDPALPDITLTLAVACLELGREEWQQNHYEHAAESLETGRELLLREDLFPVLRAEIQADLYKLRPYRCLELLARPLEQKQSRQEGLTLLRGMLQDRGGIDGAEDDLSGLGVDDFLRFVQQLRGYLTAAEQQEVFEAEAQRPSAVGTYLAVYALLARGFAQHQPTLIRRAKQMLLRLSGRQDVHLEQAVCAVLLGQTEEASRALERSQEYDPLAFIREHSQGAPDLLPGLCLYAENWLQQEVFPFFRDLDQEPATLKDYFADSSVQAYLENLPLENERSNRQTAWASAEYEGSTRLQTREAGSFAATALGQSTYGSQSFAPAGTLGNAAGSAGLGNIGNILGGTAAGIAAGAGTTRIAEKISQMSPPGQLGSSDSQNLPHVRAGDVRAGDVRTGDVRTGDVRTGEEGGAFRRERRGRRGAARSSPKWDRLALVLLAGLLCLGIAAFLAQRVIALLGGGNSNTPALEGEPLDIEINQPPVEVPESETAAAVPADDAEGIAQATIDRWLATKVKTFSSEYDSSELDSVLTGTALRENQTKLQEAQSGNWYVDYTHDSVKILSVEPTDATEAEKLSVQAEVKETSTFYEDGQPTGEADYDEVVIADYSLVRQGDQWLIEAITVE